MRANPVRAFFRVRLQTAMVLSLLLVACGAATPAATTSPTAAALATQTTTEAPLVSIKILQGADVITWAPLYLARDRYFKAQRIESESVVIAGGLAALISGDVQFAVTTVGSSLTAIEQNQPLVAVAAMTNQYGNSLVMRKDVAARLGITYESSEATKIQALKGLKLGIAVAGGGADQLARYLLRKHGVDPDRDLELIAGTNQATAIAAKQLDAFVFPSPDVELSVERGDSIWLIKGPAGDLKELNPMAYGVLLTRKDYAEKNPDVVRRVVLAVAQGTKLIKDSPDQAKSVVQTFFSKLAASTYDAAWAVNVPSFTDPTVTRSGYESNIKFVAGLGRTVKTTYEGFADTTFSEAAKKQIGWN